MDRLQHQLTQCIAACGLALLSALAACGTDASARGATITVDSIVPREVALARFRAPLPAVTALAGGAASREALIRAFVHAVTAGDTAALRGLTLSRAEFAWLYYPTATQGLPPYDLSPGLMWTMLELHGASGLRHALDAYSGRLARYVAHTCDPRVSSEGANTLYGPCVVQLNVAGHRAEQQLFGLIVHRAGRFKFVSLANKLD